jgi:hypothetical protein
MVLTDLYRRQPKFRRGIFVMAIIISVLVCAWLVPLPFRSVNLTRKMPTLFNGKVVDRLTLSLFTTTSHTDGLDFGGELFEGACLIQLQSGEKFYVRKISYRRYFDLKYRLVRATLVENRS